MAQITNKLEIELKECEVSLIKDQYGQNLYVNIRPFDYGKYTRIFPQEMELVVKSAIKYFKIDVKDVDSDGSDHSN